MAFAFGRLFPGGIGNAGLAFAHRNYRIYAGGNAVSLIGIWMQRVSVGWLAWTLAHSGTWLGIVSMGEFFPVVFLSPFAGALADRRDRVRIIRVTQIAGSIEATLLAMTYLRGIPALPVAAAQGVLRASVEAYGYASRHPGIAPMLLLFTVTTIGTRGFVELFPGFADRVFGRGPAALSMLTSTVGLGAICGGAWLLVRPGIAGLTGVVLGNTLAISLAILAFTATDRFYLALPCVFVAGCAMTITGIGAQTLIQSAVEIGMRGRIMALYGMIFRAGPALGAVLMGSLSERFGLRLPLAVGAVVSCGFWAATWLKQKRIAATLEADSPAAVEHPS